MNNKVLLYVPFEIKDEAKKMGAKGDTEEKSWVCNDDNQPCIDEYGRRYLEIRFDQKEYYKSMGCKWEPTLKKWYTYHGNKNV